MKKSILLLPVFSGICLLSIALAVSSPAQADTIIFTDFQKFNGNPPNTPVVTATIEELGSDTVKITMEATSLPSNDKITEWYFNVSLPGLLLQDFAQVTSPANVAANSVTVSYDNLSPENKVNFDILFTFPNSGSTFGTGDTSIYTVTHTGLDAADFISLSQGGGKGPYYSAIKQGLYWGTTTYTDPPTSPIPEPSVLLFLGSGLIGLVGLRRKFKK